MDSSAAGGPRATARSSFGSAPLSKPWQSNTPWDFRFVLSHNTAPLPLLFFRTALDSLLHRDNVQ
jgi:hypothetical protein